ncbi:MAG: 3-deoxy-D-manno-octulosonic acid transferase [Mariprofundaceae bacterium]|nr:3-deoxy-D-manno-octulosonic acid transferase [Mariprofundaceae bacterium]
MDLKWQQHFTFDLPVVPHGAVWVHACSMGEVASVVPIIERLLAEKKHVHLTVVTRTGKAHAHRLFADKISCSWLPWDLPLLMARFVQHLQPSLLLLCETEFWPGMFKACNKQQVPVIGINTRISDRSFPQYMATRWFWSRILAPVSLFLAQSQVDAQRLQAIGISADKIQSVGNLKFAVQAPEVDAQQVRRRVDPSLQRPILVIASSHADEEAQIMPSLSTWTRQRPDLLTLVVPRHPERFDEVAALLQQQGIVFSRYSAGVRGDESVILVDAMGVLTELYTVADLVFIGGSLVPIGGHNPLEAAVCGRGVITGQYTQNFREVMLTMQQQGAAIVVQDKDELQAAILRLLQKNHELQQLHAQATLWMQQQNQVADKMWDIIQPRL